MLYFAYGSNMNHKQMKERCPDAQFIRWGYLENFKFVYDGHSSKRSGAVANIVYSPGSKIWGGLFEINADNLAALDCYEGYSTRIYNRDEKIIKNENNDSIKAIIYSRTGEEIGKPSEEYRETIIEGAKDCGLPEKYIESL